jgi:hypothetical protein
VVAHGSFWIDLLENLFGFPLGGCCYLSLHHFFAFSPSSTSRRMASGRVKSGSF